MKKSLILVLTVLFSFVFAGPSHKMDVVATDEDIYDILNEFYNDGNYTKKSNIYLADSVLEDLARENIKVFHGGLHLERTTYYQKDDSGKDLLFMGNLDGSYAKLEGNRPVDGINSGYRTVINLDGTTYMDHFVYDGDEAIRTYKTNFVSVEDYYVTLLDFLDGPYNEEWVLNNGVYERILADSDDVQFKEFLAFTAPCLEHVFFTDETQYYFTIWDMKLTISKEVGYYGEYLSLKLIADITGESEGYFFNEDGIVSEARIYKDIKVFDESDIAVDATISDVLAGKYPVGTKVTFVGEISDVYQAWNTEFNNMSVYVQDTNRKSIIVFRTPYNLKIDEIIKVTGEVAIFNGVYQIGEGAKCEIVTNTVTDDFKHQYEMLALEVSTSGTLNFKVPLTGKYGTPIEWSCDVLDALTIENGDVILNRGEEDVDVELIATLGDYEKVFAFTIAADSGSVVEKIEKVSTLSFANKANRTTLTSSQQIWEVEGIKLINDKASSSSSVADYVNPARFYASSKITIECIEIIKIVFNCNSSSYATALKNSIGTASGATVNVSGSNVTIAFATPVDSYVIAKLSAQVRVNSITVTHLIEV